MTKWFSQPLIVKKLPDCGQLMTMEEFISCCKSGMFINYDGFGHYATKYLVTNLIVRPSDVKTNNIFSQTYTHIVWYNR